MSLYLEEYGYPQIDFMGKNENGHWIRVTQGWFLPREYKDEPSCYLDFYINEHERVIVVLEWLGIIHFEFETRLDDYLLPCSRYMTIGELYREENLKNEICSN